MATVCVVLWEDDVSMCLTSTCFIRWTCENIDWVGGKQRHACIMLYVALLILIFKSAINSLRPRNTYLHHQTMLPLVQIMDCRLCGTKPLSEPILPYCQLDPYEQISMNFFIEIQIFSLKKMHLKMLSVTGLPFCFRVNELICVI